MPRGVLALVSDEAGASGGTSGLGDRGVLLETGPEGRKGGGGGAFIAGGGAFIGRSARTGASLCGVANVDGNDGGDTVG